MHAVYERMLAIFDGFPSPAETIRRAADLLRETFGAEAISVLVHSPEQNVLLFQHIHGGSEALLGSAVPDGKGIAWSAFREGYTVIADCASDPRFLGKIDKSTGFTTRNMIALPFGFEGKALGVLELLNLPEKNLTQPQTEPVLRVMAGHIGVAYAASRLRHRLALQKQALLTANSELESKVEERTAALSAALDRVSERNDLLERAQAQLVQTEKMAALGQLAAGVAHEINNPIGFIASNLNTGRDYWTQTKMFMQRLNEANPASAEIYRKKYEMDLVEGDMGRLIEECLEGTTRVTNIVRNLKEFAHQSTVDVGPVAIHELIERTLSIALSPYKHVVTVVKDFHGPDRISCDGQAMGQVILNLAVNAAQAIGGAGTLTLRTGVEGENFVLDVIDTGAGIPAANLDRIFEPFFTTKEVGIGTGLGLSTCFHLIRKGGGELSVKSTLGEGTTFRVKLPLRQGDGEPAPGGPAHPPGVAARVPA